ncbi:MAG: hypothetical protein EOP48_22330 [Sphingobacteriales bacterium]|nr:MAG: hypothetical protein EOP48_22330 [Sphingobacteriales bacterium]
MLEAIRKDYFSANFDFFSPQRLSNFTGGQPSPQGYEKALSDSKAAIAKIQNDIPRTLKQLEEEFRKILGVE